MERFVIWLRHPFAAMVETVFDPRYPEQWPMSNAAATVCVLGKFGVLSHCFVSDPSTIWCPVKA